MLNKGSLDGWMDHALTFPAAKGMTGFRHNLAVPHRGGSLGWAPPLQGCALCRAVGALDVFWS